MIPVTLAGFSIERTGDDASLTWKVTEATDHLGFHVYREENGSDRVQINNRILSGLESYVFTDENAPQGEVDYWLAEVNRLGKLTWHGPVTLASASPIASVLVMAPAQPNPFSASTRITYSLPESRRVNLAVYDIRGRRVAMLLDLVQGPGEFTIAWDGRTARGAQASGGLYFLKLQAGNESRIQKMVLTR